MADQSTVPDFDEALKRAKAKKATAPDFDAALAAAKAKRAPPRTYEGATGVEMNRALLENQQQSARLKEEEGVPHDYAVRESMREAQEMRRVGPGAQSLGASTAVALGEEPPSLTAVAKRVVAPYVRVIEPTSQQGPRTQQDIDRELRKNVDYAAMALGEKGILETGKAILKGTAPEMSEEEVKAAGLDRPWARDLADGVATMWEGGLSGGILTGTGRAKAVEGAAMVWRGIAGYGEDKEAQKLVSPEGLTWLATRAVVKLPGGDTLLAALETGGPLKPREFDAARQTYRDSLPSQVFDSIAPGIIGADTGEVDPISAQEAILAMTPSDIPDRDAYNYPTPDRLRTRLVEQRDVLAQDPVWADVYDAIDRKNDDSLESAINALPFHEIAKVDQSVTPTLSSMIALAKRREKALAVTGGASTETLGKLIGAFTVAPTRTDEGVVWTEGKFGTAMRLAGVASEMLYEADLPLGQLPLMALAAAACDLVGAEETAEQIRGLYVPNKFGTDAMLRTGLYDDAPARLGMTSYRSRGLEDTTWESRVLGQLLTPETQGPGYAVAAGRAGLDPTSNLSRALDVVDLGVDWLMPAEEIIMGPFAFATERGARAIAGARHMPHGYRMRGALAKSLPSVYSWTRDANLVDVDGNTALHHALLNASIESINAGNIPKFSRGAREQVENAAREIGVEPKALFEALDVYAAHRKARTIQNIQDMLDGGGTPEQQALRTTAAYKARVAEYDDLVKAGKLSEQGKAWALAVDEVHSFLAAASPDATTIKTPEDFFAQVQRVVGGTSGPGAYFQGGAADEWTRGVDHARAEFERFKAEGLSPVHAAKKVKEQVVGRGKPTDPFQRGIYDAMSLPAPKVKVPKEYLDGTFNSTIGGKATGQGTIERVVREKAPTFYSALRRTVADIKQERLTAEQLRGMLAKAPGVKADEIEWTGLDRFLAEHPKPTKTEVLEWLDENAVVVEEKRLGERSPERAAWNKEFDRLWAERSVLNEMWSRTPTAEERAAWADLMRRMNEHAAVEPGRDHPSHYVGYQLPGGMNYREVLFRLPQGGDYKAPHFGSEGENLLAHTRLSDRVGPNGEKILHVEEIQSDWHQAGREKGYKGPDIDESAFWSNMERQYGMDAVERAKRDFAKGAVRVGRPMPDVVGIEYEAIPIASEIAAARRDAPVQAILRAYGDWHYPSAEMVPPAPFAKSWHELVMKRILREAAENGYDGVTWTTGVQQVKRYEDATRQAVDEVKWRRGYDSGDGLAKPAPVEIIGSKNGREVYRETMPPEKVADVLGKGMASKIAESTEASGSLSGADLTIGGEGMKGFYDQMLPSFVQKYVKKWGGKVGQTTLEVRPPLRESERAMGSTEWARDYEAASREPVHYLQLTPQMRDALLYEGQPLFQKVKGAVRGSIEPTQQQVGFLMRFFNGADDETVRHEFAHYARFMFGDGWTNDLAKHFDHVVDPATGNKVLTRAGEEQTAEAFRWYLKTKTYPNGRVRGMLDDIYVSMQNVYLRMRREPELLPSQLRQYWDATLRPDDVVRPAAIDLANERIPRPDFPTVKVPTDDRIAVGENKVAKAGRRREYERVNTERRAVQRGIGIDESVREMDAVELAARLFAYVGVEKARQGWQGEELSVLAGKRSVVPKSRLKRIREESRATMAGALGTDPKKLSIAADGTVTLTDAQAAGMYGLINTLANRPEGIETLVDEVVAFDPSKGDRTLSAEAYNDVVAHVHDMHAGIGVGRDYKVEAAQGPMLLAAVRALRDAVVDIEPVKATLESSARAFAKNFLITFEGAEYMSPAMKETISELHRRIGESGNDVLGWAKASAESLRRGGKPADLSAMFKDMLAHVTPTGVPAAPQLVADLLTEHRIFAGKTAEGINPINLTDLTDQAYLTRIQTVLESTGRKGEIGTTDAEKEALQVLRMTGVKMRTRPDEVVRVALDSTAPIISDAVGTINRGLRLRWQQVDDAATKIAHAIIGSDDEAGLAKFGSDKDGKDALLNAKLIVYTKFHEGDWDKLFRTIGERAGVDVSGPNYSQGNAILSAFVQLRVGQVVSDLWNEWRSIGIPDVDAVINRVASTNARTPTTYRMGWRGGDVEGFDKRVAHYLNTITSWKETAIEVPDGMGGVTRMLPEGVDAPEGQYDLEAYTSAHAILNAMGWKHGKGLFGEEPYHLGDGVEVYMPKMIVKQLDEVRARVAKVGIAFADTGGKLGESIAATGASLGDVVEPTPEVLAKRAATQKQRLAGAAAGAAVGGTMSGPLGGVLGAYLGSRILPKAVAGAEEAVTKAERGLAGVGAEAATPIIKPAVAAAGAVKGATNEVLAIAFGVLRRQYNLTWTMARLGLTTGLALPNFPTYMGNAFGAFFQGAEGIGASDTMRSWIGNARFVGDVVGRLWGEGPMQYRLGSDPLILPDGRILTAETVANHVVKYGMDSSLAKSLSSEILSEEVLRQQGSLLERLRRDPLDTVDAPFRWWQKQMQEAASSIDNYNRIAVYLTELRKGVGFEEAAATARLVAYDFNNLTDFERQYMRKLIIFYSYMKQNTQLFMTKLVENPSRVLGQLRLARGLQQQTVQDEPMLTTPSYIDGRLILFFNDAVRDTYAKQGVAVISPLVPMADVINLFADTLGLLTEDEAQRNMIGRLTPAMQAPFVYGQDKVIFTGRGLEDYNDVPGWLVEGANLIDGGLLMRDALRVHHDPNPTDPTSEKVWKAGNTDLWWFFKNFVQIPPFGRSMDTITAIDRAAPFGGAGPVSSALNELRAYRKAGGNEELDSLFLALRKDRADTSPVDIGTEEDVLPPRPNLGLTPEDALTYERMGMLGAKPVVINRYETEVDKLFAGVRRKAESTRNAERKTGEYEAR